MPAYKTFVLEMLQEKPEIYKRLRTSKRLLPAMETYAAALKTSHEDFAPLLVTQGHHYGEPLFNK